MEFPVIKAKARPVTGKGYANKIRALGFLPAVVYGRDTAARSIVVNPKVVTGILTGARSVNTVVQLDVEEDGKTDTCLAVIRDFSVHPVRRNVEHCDFLVVDEKTEMTVKVPVKTVGKSEGEKLGAKLNLALRTITLKCKAGDVPEAVVIDVSALQVGQTVTFSQVQYPAGTRPVYTLDRAIVSVRMPKEDKDEAGDAAATPAAGAAPAAPAAAPAASGTPAKK